MCTSDTGFRSCVIYSGDKLFIARYVKTALLYLSLSGIDSHPSHIRIRLAPSGDANAYYNKDIFSCRYDVKMCLCGIRGQRMATSDCASRSLIRAFAIQFLYTVEYFDRRCL